MQTYRALDHGTAKNQCSRILVPAKGQPGQNTQAFTSRIADFAESFVTMQGLRLDADYNPGRTFYRSDVRIQIAAAEQALNGFLGAQRAERRAFTAFVNAQGERKLKGVGTWARLWGVRHAPETGICLPPREPAGDEAPGTGAVESWNSKPTPGHPVPGPSSERGKLSPL